MVYVCIENRENLERACLIRSSELHFGSQMLSITTIPSFKIETAD